MMIKAVIFDLGNTLVRESDGQVLPNAIETLRELKKDYKIALISNTLPQTTAEKVHQILREAQLLDFFDVVVVSSEVGVSKPDPQIFSLTLKKLGVKPEEAVMVGNTISTDIFGGNRVGMKTVLLQQSKDYKRSEWENPTHTINSLKELLVVI